MTQEGDNDLYAQKGTTGPILVNPIRESSLEKAISEIKNVVKVSSNLNDYENKMQQMRSVSDSMSRRHKLRKKMRQAQHGGYEPRYSRHTAAMYTKNPAKAANFNHYMEHIYESIDNESVGSCIYDPKVLYNCSLFEPRQVSHLYGVSNLQEDEWSQNSSSSYGPLYDEKPLLIGSTSLLDTANNINSPLFNNINPSNTEQSCELSNQDAPTASGKKAKNTSTFGSSQASSDFLNIRIPSQITRNFTKKGWNINSSSSELPDLIQYQCDNSLEETRAENEELKQRTTLQSEVKDSTSKCITVPSSTHSKVGTYC